MTYRCQECGAVFEQLPQWEERECPSDELQHYFVKEVKAE